MDYGRGEQYLNSDALLPHHHTHPADHVDASASPTLPILHYLGLGNAAPLAADQLAPALKHPTWEIRVQAIRQLERSQDQNFIALLIMALKDEHQAVRAAAARALGTYTALQDLPGVSLATALQDTSWLVRVEAALALGKYHDRAPVGPLLAALEDEDEAVRAAIVSALGQLGERVPVEFLVKALYDPSWSVREAAAYALSGQGTRTSVTPLLLARDDEDSSVRDAIEWAIQQTYPEMLTTTAFNTITPAEQKDSPSTHNEFMDAPHKQNEGDLSPENPQPLPTKRQATINTTLTPRRQRKAAKPARRILIGRILERGLAAAVVIGIALSWLLLNRGVTSSNTGSLWNVSLAFKQQASHGSVFTKVAWITAGQQDTPIITAIDTRGHIYLWNTYSGETSEMATGFQHVVALTRVGNSLLIAYTRSGDSMLRLDRVVVAADMQAQVETIAPLAGPASAPTLASWSPDGKRIAVIWHGQQGNKTENMEQVQIWDIARQKSISILPACSTTLDKNGLLEQKPGIIKALAWTGDSKEISTACTSNDNDHTIETWNTATGQPAKVLNNKLAQYRPISVADEVTALTWSPNDNYLAYLLVDGEAHVLPQKSDQMSDIWLNYGYSNHSQAFSGTLAWSSNSQDLAATTAAITPPGTVIGWDTTGNQLYTYSGHTQPVYDIAWSLNGKAIASVGKDGTLQVWSTSP